MLFIQPMRRFWRFDERQWPQKDESVPTTNTTADISADRHHTKAMEDLQKVRRNHFLERGASF